MKIKQSEKNMRVMVIPVLVCMHRMVLKGLERRCEEFEIKEESKLSKLQHCWDQPEYSEKSWRPQKTCNYPDFKERPLTNSGVKNSQRPKW